MTKPEMIRDLRVQAKWIHCVAKPVISNGIIEIRDGVITAIVKPKSHQANTIDLGAVSLIPGMVNAHTHLEFSDLEQPLGQSGIAFTDWIQLVVSRRTNVQGIPEAKSNAIRLGISESIDAGVIAVGEIASDPIVVGDYGDELVSTIFHERLGRHPERIRSIIEMAAQFGASFGNGMKQKYGISPHAPYSVHPELLAESVRQSQQFNCPLAMHLAETREELELLRDQTGPFVDLLKSLNAWYPETFCLGTTILDYLRPISEAPRSIVVHGNYLSDADLEFMVQFRSKMSVVYCPRTHDFFQHDAYPLNRLLDAGINVAVGTDSRASNQDLCLFSELKMIQQKFPKLEPEKILEMGTLAGSMALGIDVRNGTIGTGHAAQINVVDCHEIQNLFGPTSTCVPLARYLGNY